MSVKKIVTVVLSCALAFGFILAVALFPAAGEDRLPSVATGRGGLLRAGSGSDKYTLTVDETSLAIEVTEVGTNRTVLKSDNILPDDKQSGYDNGLNSFWEKTAYSAVTVYYTNEKIYKPLTDFSGVETTVTKTDTGFSARVKIGEIGLRFTLNVSLTDEGLTVLIPSSSIEETKTARYPLVSLNVYPFMNATRGVRDDGFILVPDGSGAIVDLTQKTLARNAYNARVFGDDIGITGINTLKQYGDLPPLTVSYPVFGFSDAGKGYFANVTSGAEYSRITAYASGVTTDYNFAYAGFVYRESFYMPVDNKGTTVTRIQPDRNDFDASITYTILDNADVASMATVYRNSLLSRGLLGKRLTGNSSPLKVDFLMADNYDDSFGAATVRATDTEDVQRALAQLKADGVQQTVAGLIGYSKGGVTGAQPKHFPVGSSGSASDYRRLAEYAQQNGVTLMPVTDYVRAYNKDYTKAGGSYGQRDLGMSLGKDVLSLRDYRQNGNKYDDFLLLHAAATETFLADDLTEVRKIGFGGIQLDGIGSILNSSAENARMTRTQAKERYEHAVALPDMPTAVERPNEYLFRYTDYYVNAPTFGSRYMIALNSVPFLQMALSGHMVLYRDYVNLRRSDTDVLTMLEYNVYPSYVFTQCSAYDLHRTASGWIFSSQFDELKADAVKTYLEVDSVLGKVRGAQFVGYERRDGATVCTYDNGVRLYLNYGAEPTVCDGVTVPAGGYAVTEATA